MRCPAIDTVYRGNVPPERHECTEPNGHIGPHRSENHSWWGFPWPAGDARWNDPEERARALRDLITLSRG